MGKIQFPTGAQSVPALDANSQERLQDAKDKHRAFVANTRKARTEANPDAPKYDGGFPEGHPNASIISNHQREQADLAVSLDNARKARKPR